MYYHLEAIIEPIIHFPCSQRLLDEFEQRPVVHPKYAQTAFHTQDRPPEVS